MYTTLIWAIIAVAILPFSSALDVSRSGRCGPRFGLTCEDGRFGDCCFKYNYCGSTTDYYGAGCQSGYGKCNSDPTPSPSVSLAIISNDGTCGGRKGFTCLNSSFGNCCSQYGWCGSTSAFCSTGCNSAFGTCSDSPSPLLTSSISSTTSTPTSSFPIPSPTFKVTTNARCGTGFGFTYQSSQWGNCCSKYSYCGETDAYCGKGCQSGFGTWSDDASSSLTSTSSPSGSIPSTSWSSPSSSSSTTTSLTCPLLTAANPKDIGPPLVFSTPCSETASPTSSSTIEMLSTASTLISSSSACPTQTNLVQNPSFEFGMDFRSFLTTGLWSTVIMNQPGHDASGYFYTYSYEYNEITFTALQQDIQTPSGTAIQASAGVQSSRNPDTNCNIDLYLDDTLIASLVFVAYQGASIAEANIDVLEGKWPVSLEAGNDETI